MAGSARQKIDPQTRDMFDPEVERPDHDKILTNLFADDASLLRLLAGLHKDVTLAPFTTESRFKVFHSRGEFNKWVGYSEAVELTGIAPRWESNSPIRVASKQLEIPMLWFSENGRSSRIMGFCDIGIGYQIVEWPQIELSSTGHYSWVGNAVNGHALIEVKGAWPTVGNLVRQLNLYRHSTPIGLKGRCQLLLVGPDASMNEIACQHRYRLATFDASGKSFTLLDGDSTPPRDSSPEGTF